MSTPSATSRKTDDVEAAADIDTTGATPNRHPPPSEAASGGDAPASASHTLIHAAKTAGEVVMRGVTAVRRTTSHAVTAVRRTTSIAVNAARTLLPGEKRMKIRDKTGRLLVPGSDITVIGQREREARATQHVSAIATEHRTNAGEFFTAPDEREVAPVVCYASTTKQPDTFLRQLGIIRQTATLSDSRECYYDPRLRAWIASGTGDPVDADAIFSKEPNANATARTRRRDQAVAQPQQRTNTTANAAERREQQQRAQDEVDAVWPQRSLIPHSEARHSLRSVPAVLKNVRDSTPSSVICVLGDLQTSFFAAADDDPHSDSEDQGGANHDVDSHNDDARGGGGSPADGEAGGPEATMEDAAAREQESERLAMMRAFHDTGGSSVASHGHHAAPRNWGGFASGLQRAAAARNAMPSVGGAASSRHHHATNAHASHLSPDIRRIALRRLQQYCDKSLLDAAQRSDALLLISAGNSALAYRIAEAVARRKPSKSGDEAPPTINVLGVSAIPAPALSDELNEGGSFSASSNSFRAALRPLRPAAPKRLLAPYFTHHLVVMRSMRLRRHDNLPLSSRCLGFRLPQDKLESSPPGDDASLITVLDEAQRTQRVEPSLRCLDCGMDATSHLPLWLRRHQEAVHERQRRHATHPRTKSVAWGAVPPSSPMLIDLGGSSVGQPADVGGKGIDAHHETEDADADEDDQSVVLQDQPCQREIMDVILRSLECFSRGSRAGSGGSNDGGGGDAAEASLTESNTDRNRDTSDAALVPPRPPVPVVVVIFGGDSVVMRRVVTTCISRGYYCILMEGSGGFADEICAVRSKVADMLRQDHAHGDSSSKGGGGGGTEDHQQQQQIFFSDLLIQCSCALDPLSSSIASDLEHVRIVKAGTRPEEFSRMIEGLLAGSQALRQAWLNYATLDQNAELYKKYYSRLQLFIVAVTVLTCVAAVAHTFVVIMQQRALGINAAAQSNTTTTSTGSFAATEDIVGSDASGSLTPTDAAGLSVGSRVMEWVVVGLPIFLSFLQALGVRLNAGEKWTQLRLAATRLQCEIYRFRSGVSPYQSSEVDREAAQGRGQDDDHAADAGGDEHDTATSAALDATPEKELERKQDGILEDVKHIVLECYRGPPVPHHIMNNGDDGFTSFSSLPTKAYVALRLLPLHAFMQDKSVSYGLSIQFDRGLIGVFSALGTVAAVASGSIDPAIIVWVAASTAVITAVQRHLEYSRIESLHKRYNLAMVELKSISAWWTALGPHCELGANREALVQRTEQTMMNVTIFWANQMAASIETERKDAKDAVKAMDKAVAKNAGKKDDDQGGGGNGAASSSSGGGGDGNSRALIDQRQSKRKSGGSGDQVRPLPGSLQQLSVLAPSELAVLIKHAEAPPLPGVRPDGGSSGGDASRMHAEICAKKTAAIAVLRSLRDRLGPDPTAHGLPPLVHPTGRNPNRPSVLAITPASKRIEEEQRGTRRAIADEDHAAMVEAQKLQSRRHAVHRRAETSLFEISLAKPLALPNTATAAVKSSNLRRRFLVSLLFKGRATAAHHQRFEAVTANIMTDQKHNNFTTSNVMTPLHPRTTPQRSASAKPPSTAAVASKRPPATLPSSVGSRAVATSGSFPQGDDGAASDGGGASTRGGGTTRGAAPPPAGSWTPTASLLPPHHHRSGTASPSLPERSSRQLRQIMRTADFITDRVDPAATFQQSLALASRSSNLSGSIGAAAVPSGVPAGVTNRPFPVTKTGGFRGGAELHGAATTDGNLAAPAAPTGTTYSDANAAALLLMQFQQQLDDPKGQKVARKAQQQRSRLAETKSKQKHAMALRLGGAATSQETAGGPGEDLSRAAPRRFHRLSWHTMAELFPGSFLRASSASIMDIEDAARAAHPSAFSSTFGYSTVAEVPTEDADIQEDGTGGAASSSVPDMRRPFLLALIAASMELMHDMLNFELQGDRIHVNDLVGSRSVVSGDSRGGFSDENKHTEFGNGGGGASAEDDHGATGGETGEDVRKALSALDFMCALSVVVSATRRNGQKSGRERTQRRRKQWLAAAELRRRRALRGRDYSSSSSSSDSSSSTADSDENSSSSSNSGSNDDAEDDCLPAALLCDALPSPGHRLSLRRALTTMLQPDAYAKRLQRRAMSRLSEERCVLWLLCSHAASAIAELQVADLLTAPPKGGIVDDAGASGHHGGGRATLLLLDILKQASLRSPPSLTPLETQVLRSTGGDTFPASSAVAPHRHDSGEQRYRGGRLNSGHHASLSTSARIALGCAVLQAAVSDVAKQTAFVEAASKQRLLQLIPKAMSERQVCLSQMIPGGGRALRPTGGHDMDVVTATVADVFRGLPHIILRHVIGHVSRIEAPLRSLDEVIRLAAGTTLLEDAYRSQWEPAHASWEGACRCYLREAVASVGQRSKGEGQEAFAVPNRFRIRSCAAWKRHALGACRHHAWRNEPAIAVIQPPGGALTWDAQDAEVGDESSADLSAWWHRALIWQDFSASSPPSNNHAEEVVAAGTAAASVGDDAAATFTHILRALLCELQDELNAPHPSQSTRRPRSNRGVGLPTLNESVARRGLLAQLSGRRNAAATAVDDGGSVTDITQVSLELLNELVSTDHVASKAAFLELVYNASWPSLLATRPDHAFMSHQVLVRQFRQLLFGHDAMSPPPLLESSSGGGRQHPSGGGVGAANKPQPVVAPPLESAEGHPSQEETMHRAAAWLTYSRLVRLFESFPLPDALLGFMRGVKTQVWRTFPFFVIDVMAVETPSVNVNLSEVLHPAEVPLLAERIDDIYATCLGSWYDVASITAASRGRASPITSGLKAPSTSKSASTSSPGRRGRAGDEGDGTRSGGVSAGRIVRFFGKSAVSARLAGVLTEEADLNGILMSVVESCRVPPLLIQAFVRLFGRHRHRRRPTIVENVVVVPVDQKKVIAAQGRSGVGRNPAESGGPTVPQATSMKSPRKDANVTPVDPQGGGGGGEDEHSGLASAGWLSTAILDALKASDSWSPTTLLQLLHSAVVALDPHLILPPPAFPSFEPDDLDEPAAAGISPERDEGGVVPRRGAHPPLPSWCTMPDALRQTLLHFDGALMYRGKHRNAVASSRNSVNATDETLPSTKSGAVATASSGAGGRCVDPLEVTIEAVATPTSPGTRRDQDDVSCGGSDTSDSDRDSPPQHHNSNAEEMQAAVDAIRGETRSVVMAGGQTAPSWPGDKAHHPPPATALRGGPLPSHTTATANSITLTSAASSLLFTNFTARMNATRDLLSPDMASVFSGSKGDTQLRSLLVTVRRHMSDAFGVLRIFDDVIHSRLFTGTQVRGLIDLFSTPGARAACLLSLLRACDLVSKREEAAAATSETDDVSSSLSRQLLWFGAASADSEVEVVGPQRDLLRLWSITAAAAENAAGTATGGGWFLRLRNILACSDTSTKVQDLRPLTPTMVFPTVPSVRADLHGPTLASQRSLLVFAHRLYLFSALTLPLAAFLELSAAIDGVSLGKVFSTYRSRLELSAMLLPRLRSISGACTVVVTSSTAAPELSRPPAEQKGNAAMVAPQSDSDLLVERSDTAPPQEDDPTAAAADGSGGAVERSEPAPAVATAPREAEDIGASSRASSEAPSAFPKTRLLVARRWTADGTVLYDRGMVRGLASSSPSSPMPLSLTMETTCLEALAPANTVAPRQQQLLRQLEMLARFLPESEEGGQADRFGTDGTDVTPNLPQLHASLITMFSKKVITELQRQRSLLRKLISIECPELMSLVADESALARTMAYLSTSPTGSSGGGGEDAGYCPAHVLAACVNVYERRVRPHSVAGLGCAWLSRCLFSAKDERIDGGSHLEAEGRSDKPAVVARKMMLPATTTLWLLGCPLCIASPTVGGWGGGDAASSAVTLALHHLVADIRECSPSLLGTAVQRALSSLHDDDGEDEDRVGPAAKAQQEADRRGVVRSVMNAVGADVLAGLHALLLSALRHAAIVAEAMNGVVQLAAFVSLSAPSRRALMDKSGLPWSALQQKSLLAVTAPPRLFGGRGRPAANGSAGRRASPSPTALTPRGGVGAPIDGSAPTPISLRTQTSEGDTSDGAPLTAKQLRDLTPRWSSATAAFHHMHASLLFAVMGLALTTESTASRQQQGVDAWSQLCAKTSSSS